MNQKSEIVRLLDYTSLTGEESDAQIRRLAREAHSPLGPVAAICVHPRYVSLVKDAFVHAKQPILAVASVVNFPGGEFPLDEVIAEIHYALQQGADEIDVVLPCPKHSLYESAEQKLDFLAACRNETHGKVLKLIIESGRLSPEEIRRASELGIAAGADFIKTSTGKIRVGATLDAAKIVLECIRGSGKPCGLKVSGGIRNLTTAQSYMNLAIDIMGRDFLQPQTFRFGASTLLKTLVEDDADIAD